MEQKLKLQPWDDRGAGLYRAGIFLATLATISLWPPAPAVAEDPTPPRLVGINSAAMVRLAFLISGVLAGLGGGLIGMSVSLAGPYFGISYGLKGLAVLVLGGLGSVPGAIAGGLLMGLAEALIPSEASGWRDALAFAVLFAVLLLRPSGLLGRRQLEKV